MSWRVAQSLEVLLAEVNAAAPNRNKASDGSIGDVAHQKAGTSDHLPNSAGVVRARDFTNDPFGGCDSSTLAERVRLLGIKGHPALASGAYVISDGRIASSTYGWGWRTYTGSNPHDHHCHVSVATASAGYDSTAPWGVMGEPDDMAQHTDQLNRIEAAALAAVTAAKSTKARVDKMGANLKADRANDKALLRALREVGVDVDQVLKLAEKHDAES